MLPGESGRGDEGLRVEGSGIGDDMRGGGEGGDDVRGGGEERDESAGGEGGSISGKDVLVQLN